MRLVLFLCCLCTLGGCSAGGSLTAADAPRFRLGAMPFPGWMTLYVACDPRDLGQHRTERSALPFGDHPDEVSRGIMYTCRGGFLDLAHIRETVDWARFVHGRVLASLDTGESFAFECFDARFDVVVQLPEDWAQMSSERRAAEASELAARFAARTAMNIGTWHEIATWHGYQTIPGISEHRSAFTWDDSTSHIVGALVAERALRSTRSFDDAVTDELDRVLASLEPVSTEDERAAVRSVDGVWYRSGTPLRRDLDVGLEAGVKHPWRVAGLGCCEPMVTDPLVIPQERIASGRSVSEVFEIRIAPRPWIARRVFDTPASTQQLLLEPALLVAINRIRNDLLANAGDGVDQP